MNQYILPDPGESCMLPDHLTQLLTTYLDGEANLSQRKAVQDLLGRSAEARTLWQQLQEDAQRLHNLPRRRLEADLAPKVLRAIAARRPGYSRRLANLNLPPYPAWMGVAVAASVLMVIGFGSYLYVEVARRLPSAQAVRKEGSSSTPRDKQPELNREIVNVKPAAPASEKRPAPPEVLPAPADLVQSEGVAPPSRSPTPRPEAPRPPARDEFAIPTPKTEGLEIVSPGIALNLALRDLDQGQWRERLRQDLRRDNFFRLELFCLSNGKVRERLNAAFRAAGVRLVIEPEAQSRLKNHRLKGDYALYTEALTAEGLAKVLEHLGKADKQADAKRRGDRQFDRLFVWPVNPTDRKELTALFGFDPFQAPSPKPKAPLGVDIRKPVAEDTAAQVAQALARQGAPRRESNKTTTPKTPARVALLVPYVPNRSRPPASKEMKTLLESRKSRTPGTVQLFLVLREVNG